MKNNEEYGDKSKGAAEAAAGGLAGKSLFDRGFIDGRSTLYHGTSEDAAKKIRSEGLKAKYTGKGSKEAKSVTDILDKEVLQKSKGHTFFDRSRLNASMYASQHRNGDRVVQDAETLPRAMKNFFGFNKGVVKSRVPLHEKKTIQNPETFGSFEKWDKHMEGKNPAWKNVNGAQKRQTFNALNDAVVVKGDIGTNFIKGSGKYKMANMAEYGRFASKNKGKAALGIAGGAMALGMIGDGARRAYRGLRDA